MSWADYSDDEFEEVELDDKPTVQVSDSQGFEVPRKRKIRDIRDDIIVFSDDYKWPNKQFRFIVKSRQAMREKLYAEKIKYWHGYVPANQSIIYRGERNQMQTEYASQEYIATLLHCLPESIWKLYFK